MSTLNTSLITKRRKGISLVPALLVLMLLLLCSANIHAAPVLSDTSGSAILPDTGKYDLNDPRNPDCPCHKAQKLADDEYRNSQLQQVNKNPVDNNPVNNNNPINQDDNSNHNNNDVNRGNPADRGNSNPVEHVNEHTNSNAGQTSHSGGVSVPQGHYSKFYKFSKKMKRWTKKMNRKLKSKNKGTKGGKFRVADCFHWM